MEEEPRTHYYSLVFTFFFFLFLTFAESLLYGEEHMTLLQLKNHWGNPPSLSHWTAKNSYHCKWPEIKCLENSVTGIKVNDMNISRTVPSLICDLKNLTVIQLQNNFIPGTFPTSLYNCSRLTHLNLAENYFVGSLPDDINRLSQLQFLDLSANNFSGDIPNAIAQLLSLTVLRLDSNLFSGNFPQEIGNMTNLEELSIAYNPMAPARFPSSFAKLKNVQMLLMGNVSLIGEIPEEIGEMEALQVLDLTYNNLTGEIPSSLLMLKNLSSLFLYNNNFSGEVPPINGAWNLIAIDLSSNNLSGKVPESFGELQQLTVLNLFYNNFSGEIPVGLARIPTLITVNVYNNSFTGVLPPDFGRYSTLEEFQVNNNKFTGKLPEYLCAAGSLVGMVAGNNNLTGELPSSLQSCSTLTMVNVEMNQLSGSIPDGLWRSSNLSTFFVNDNMFTGELPDEMPMNLTRLDIRNNRFSGKITVAGVSMMKNLRVFRASNNLFSGMIPVEITGLPSLTTLLLDQNQLTGSLPSHIISWSSLVTLNLSHNQISGQIPEGISHLPVLSELDLSNNQISGQIPAQIGSLKLTQLNLSSNRLTGRIPTELENGAYSSSFLNNSGLCATSSSVKINVCNFQTQRSIKKKKSSHNLTWILSTLIAAFLVSLLLTLLVIRKYRKAKRDARPQWRFTSFQKLDFTESTIISGIQESNEIGSGGSGKVYCVVTNPSGDVVAVKMIECTKKLDRKLEKEFSAEVQTLSSIRHSNIVKLLCFILGDTAKLLVYEYMENGSLEQWLRKMHISSTVSGERPRSALNWPTRLKIAIGAAKGLKYLHHDCVPPIVHHDVKPGNILLDSEFNAKIADFGLSKILVKAEESATASIVAGSLGYIAPERAYMSKVNEKADVYSFGVILLQLTTGKDAKIGEEHVCIAEWARQHLQEGNHIADALDDRIKEPSHLDEMINTFTLGIVCTNTVPSSRPSMKEVTEILLHGGKPLDVSCFMKGQSLDVSGRSTYSENDVAPLLRDSDSQEASTSSSNSQFESIIDMDSI